MPKTFYLTTPIYYVNAPPHLGHAYTNVLADVIARSRRLLGEEVWFLTGTDEHGAKISRAAEEAGEEISQFVSRGRETFKRLAAVLGLSHTDFISTSDQTRHWPGARKLWQTLVASGDIYKGMYQGFYCLGHEAFVTEKDLVEGKCQDHGEAPQLIEEENYFFRLSRYTSEIKKRIESGELLILPEGRKNEMLSFLDEGLRDISFSRPSKDIPWGIPVPGDDTQRVYVWCDALSNYISALGYGQEDETKFQKFWPADLHIIGKDILRFHAAYWPAMLLSAGLPLPKTILVHGLIQVGGRKMSKSLGNVIDPFAVVEKYGADALRYYFLREVPVFEDGDFTEEKFHEAYEANLVNGVGNYIRRVSTMIQTYFSSRIAKPSESSLANVPLLKSLGALSKFLEKDSKKVEYFSVPYVIEKIVEPQYRKAIESYDINRAADFVFELLSELDHYVQDYEPFKLIQTDREKTQAVLWNLAYGAVWIAKFLSPFLPETSDKIFGVLGVAGKEGEFSEFVVRDHEPLFPRISG